MAEPVAENRIVQLTRTIAAPRQRVFDAWTDADHLVKWWARAPGVTVPAAEIDLRDGGSYRVVMRGEGLELEIVGTFLEVVPPARVVYSFRWEPDWLDVGDSLVTVQFRELGESTEVLLTHEGFVSTGAHNFHAYGWTSSFDRLDTLLSGGDPGP